MGAYQGFVAPHVSGGALDVGGDPHLAVDEGLGARGGQAMVKGLVRFDGSWTRRLIVSRGWRVRGGSVRVWGVCGAGF